MTRRVLVIEPDATLRRMMEYALSAAGFVPSGTATIESSRILLDGKQVDVAVVDLRATSTEAVNAVQSFRSDYPELPLVATGTLLTSRVLEELLRASVDDVVRKPFAPRELVAAVQRVLGNARARRDGALEYAAAMAAARRAIVDGRPRDAEAPLERARARSPLDAEAMALFGLVRELGGEDRTADRAYRAALALADEFVTEDALPRDGLARLRAYGGASVVPAFERDGRHRLWFVSDPAGELPLGAPAGVPPDVTVFALGLVPSELGAMYARLGRDQHAFFIASGAMTERLVQRLAHSFGQATVLSHPATRARLGAMARFGDDSRLEE